MEKIKSAKKYTPSDDLWVVSCFYNSNAYKSKPKNFELFIESIEKSNLNYLIVECAFGRQPFSLKKSPNIIRVRAQDVIWQKERLLNIAIDNLPAKCKKVAWLDCDVLFENPDWAKETSEKLNHYKVLQPFKEAIRLPKGTIQYSGDGDRFFSFGYVMKHFPYPLLEGNFELHGHTGFGWASSKAILKKHGLYDACIAGSGDHMMAHTFVGDWTTRCINYVIGQNEKYYNHYIDWSKNIFKDIKSKISYVDGTLLHLWHGDVENRNYVLRQRTLEKLQFDPMKDIVLDKMNCWKWNRKTNRLKKWGKEYFKLRKEDQ